MNPATITLPCLNLCIHMHQLSLPSSSLRPNVCFVTVHNPQQGKDYSKRIEGCRGNRQPRITKQVGVPHRCWGRNGAKAPLLVESSIAALQEADGHSSRSAGRRTTAVSASTLNHTGESTAHAMHANVTACLVLRRAIATQAPCHPDKEITSFISAHLQIAHEALRHAGKLGPRLAGNLRMRTAGSKVFVAHTQDLGNWGTAQVACLCWKTLQEHFACMLRACSTAAVGGDGTVL